MNEASLLKIQGGEGNPSNGFFVIITLNFFKLWEVFIDHLLDLSLRVAFLWVRGEGRAGRAKMPRLVAVEAETVFNTTFSFFWGHLGDTYDINIHGVGVFSRFRW